MKILMVNKFLYPRGGAESYMLKLGKALSALGHTVEYFGMYDAKNTVGNTAGLYTQNMDFHGKTVARFLYPFKIIYSCEAAQKIGKVLDSFQPDIVHMHNINFQLTPSIIYAVKKRNIPLVQTVHDYQMICPNHLLYSFQEGAPCTRCIGGSRRSCIKHRCIHDSLVKSILGVIEANLYRRLGTYKKVDLYICPSQFLANKLTEASPLYKGKTFVLHNFIEKKEPAASENAEPYIVFAGRLSKEKGVELIRDAARHLPQYRFVVLGDGPDKDVLSGIPNIEMPGFLVGQELENVMGNAKVLLAPSVCFENCPLSILEAHAKGVPVVTMNSGGMAELVEDGVTGTLADYPDGVHVAKAIRKTLSDEEYYKTLKANCAKRREKICTVEAYTETLLEKYRALLGRRDTCV